MKEDKELYKEFVEGRKEALNELMIRYRNEIIYFIHKFVNDYQAAEDLSQEVFVYLLQHKEIYDFKFQFRTYLYMIAKSRAYNYMKARRKIFFLEDNADNIYNEISDVEEEIFKNSECAMVRDAMRKLKKEYHMAIYLVDLNGLSYEETGTIMGKSISQVKALVHNARKRLKVFLEKEISKEVEHNEINGRIH